MLELRFEPTGVHLAVMLLLFTVRYRQSWPFKDSAPDFRSDVKNSPLPESHVWNDGNTETLRKMSCSWLPSALLWFQLATVISLWLCWQKTLVGTIPFWTLVPFPVW